MALKKKQLRNEEPLQLSVWLPHQLSTRLDDLCKIVNENSVGRIHRKVLAAAILYGAPETAEDLNTLLDNYIAASPEDATVGKDKGAKVYPFERAKPGPRPA